jgi:4-hydroxy-tetrahydrodipicolinate reductase
MKLALLGFGKMGKTIEGLALQKGHIIVYKNTSTIEEGSLKEADVAIEFSNPQAAVGNIYKCFELGIPIVSGTTGWLAELPKVKKDCESRNRTFIYASNFSIGVHLFFNLNEHLVKLMAPWEDYSAAIEEIHHTQKLDAPSGTAITLAEQIIDKHPVKENWTLEEKEEEKSIFIDAIRTPNVKGTHTVKYTSKIDTISIKHEANSREGFAKGAILAAEFIKDKKGIFTMKDVLEI